MRWEKSMVHDRGDHFIGYLTVTNQKFDRGRRYPVKAILQRVPPHLPQLFSTSKQQLIHPKSRKTIPKGKKLLKNIND
jgi:hypothetical protein